MVHIIATCAVQVLGEHFRLTTIIFVQRGGFFDLEQNYPLDLFIPLSTVLIVYLISRKTHKTFKKMNFDIACALLPLSSTKLETIFNLKVLGQTHFLQ